MPRVHPLRFAAQLGGSSPLTPVGSVVLPSSSAIKTQKSKLPAGEGLARSRGRPRPRAAFRRPRAVWRALPPRRPS